MSNLVILTPTFQRPDTILWSIESVLRQKFGKVNFTKKIFILNNDPGSKEEVDNSVRTAIARVPDHEFDEIKILQGDLTVPSIKNIYGHLQRLSIEGDITIIHCDDDIMLPNTLLHRFQAAVDAPAPVCIARTLWSCFFLKGKPDIYLGMIKDPYKRGEVYTYQKAVKEDITSYSLAFISVYSYRMDADFWSVFDEAVRWADELPLGHRTKYPFVPFFIGLAAYHKNMLGVGAEDVVIRGQLFALRRFLPPFTVTEYANGGIIQMTGLAILNNSDLKDNADYDLIRKIQRDVTKESILPSYIRRDGVSLAKRKELVKLTHSNYKWSEMTGKVIFKNIRNTLDNLIFTRNIKRWITGFGPKTSPEAFWKEWEKNNGKEA